MVVSLLFLFGCKKDDASGCFTRVGDITTEERVFDSPFRTIELRDDVVVYLSQGSENKAVVRGGDRLLGSYKTRIEGHKLVMENLTTCKWLRDLETPFEVYLTMTDIDTILFNGYGDLFSQGDFEVDTLWFESNDGIGDVELNLVNGSRLNMIMHTGAVNVKLKGNSDYVYAYSRSLSILDMNELVVPEAYYANYGVGDFHVSASDYFKAILDHTGDIYYSGDPEIFIESQLGSGQLIAQ